VKQEFGLLTLSGITEHDCPDCGGHLHLIGTEPDGSFLFRCLEHRKVPAQNHVDRYTSEAQAPPHHFDYYSLHRRGGPVVRYGDKPVPGGKMDPEQRLWILDLACGAFLIRPEDTDYLVVQSGTDWCHSIQVLFHDGVVLAEVNPRNWDTCTVCKNRVLTHTAVDALRQFGFTGGKPKSNFARDGLAASSPSLARLIERLFMIAYHESPDVAVGVRFRHADLAAKFADRAGMLRAG
jgi:hypothetical protein